MTVSNQTYAMPLSFSQERLWFFDQVAPGQSVYHIGSGLQLEGELHFSALEKAIQQVVARHEILRTTFQKVDGVPMQVIQETLQIPLAFTDLSSFSDKDVLAREVGQKEYDLPFDLSCGPLLRFRLVKLDSRCHLLFFNLHHIIADGWSMGVFTSELRTFYHGFCSGVAVSLEPLPLQFGDFAAWQREFLTGDRLTADLAFWRKELDGAPAATGLPADYLRSAVQQFPGATCHFNIDSHICHRIHQVAEQTNSSLFMVLLAGFSVLLGRYLDRTDLVIGAAIANRDRAELESLIGFFVNSLPLRIRYSENLSFAELVQKVKFSCLDAYSHQGIPFEKIVEELKPDRDGGISPLFQVMFAFQNVAEERFTLPGLTITSYPLERSNSSFDLSLLMEEQDGLSGSFEYNTSLYRPETIQRLIENFQTVLEALVTSPSLPLEDASILSRAEQHKLLTFWNQTSRPLNSNRSLSTWFEQAANENLTKTAIREIRHKENQISAFSWSYAELLEKVNGIAGTLADAGIGQGDIVGVGLHRSFEMVCSIFAIIKVGATYLPLDPEYPSGRLQFMVTDSRASVILTLDSQKAAFSGLSVSLFDVHASWGRRNNHVNASPSTESLIYVIYTSGSTGQPKGAAVFQEGFINLLTWFIDAFQLSASDSPLLVSSLSFDLTQKNIFAPLLLGGTLLLNVDDHYDPASILKVIALEKPTWVNCTPSTFYPVVDVERLDVVSSLSSLRYLILGGENIVMRRLWRWMGNGGCNARLVNTYGPTECTDICCAFFVNQPEQFLDRTIPIGKPIHNSQLFILDSRLRPVPVGVTGELWLAGRGVGQGYIHDPSATAVTFLPHPFSHDSQRIYRLKDHGRYLSSGDIEFTGRTDNQVKVRGHRIELQEIETALLKHPEIHEAVVILQETDQMVHDVAAHIILKNPVPSLELELSFKALLLKSLPDHMIPRWFVFHEQFPLTGSGKIDRRALHLPAGNLPCIPAVAPSSSTERMVSEIWTEVLHKPVLDVNLGFFELGGHSLLAVQVMTRLSDSVGLDLPVRILFEHTTVARLAAEIEKREIASLDSLELDILAHNTVAHEIQVHAP